MEPSPCAAYVTLIARYFRWDEHFILWELPLCRGHAYSHALMRMHSVNTQPSTGNSLHNEI